MRRSPKGYCGHMTAYARLQRRKAGFANLSGFSVGRKYAPGAADRHLHHADPDVDDPCGAGKGVQGRREHAISRLAAYPWAATAQMTTSAAAQMAARTQGAMVGLEAGCRMAYFIG